MDQSFIIVGKGGREHALASMLARSSKVYSFGGADAIRHIAEPLDAGLAVDLGKGLTDEALSALLSHPESIIVFGPEQPMAAGWVDQIKLKAPDQNVLGPNQYAAQLESSKWWAKEFMVRNDVPTGAAERIKKVEDFDRFTLQFEPPYVIKADGLAAGKGVAIFEAVGEARAFVAGIVSGDLFGTPQTALIEEFLTGPELSIFLLLDGTSAMQIGTARDYKRAFDGDAGPNTGGMGSYTPVPEVTEAEQQVIYDKVLRPILDGLKRDGLNYRGFLYVGLMRTPRGYKVLEFNVRMGDPETQAVLPVLGDRLPALLAGAANGQLASIALDGVERVSDDFYRVVSTSAAVCVVLADPDYPASSTAVTPLEGLSTPLPTSETEHFVFHAGTRQQDGIWASNGGRVLNVVALGSSVSEARAACYSAVEQLNLKMLRHRTDIALGA